MAASEWNVPLRPVKPWQMTFVFLSTRTAMSGGSDRLDDLLRGIIKIVGGNHVESRFRDDALAEIDIGAFEPHHQRHLQPDFLDGRYDAFGDDVTAHDPAEDIDQDAFDVRVGGDDLESRRHLLLCSAAPDIEKICRRGAVELDDVHGGHGEAGAVDHATDGAFERDVVQVVFGRLDFLFVLLGEVAQRGNIRVTIKRVVVEADLRIETNQLTSLGDDERIDLEEAHVLGKERLVE